MKPSDKGSTTNSSTTTSATGTPASFAQELGTPPDLVLQMLKEFGFEDVQEDTSFPAEDQRALLNALRRRLAREERDPDGQKKQRADAAFEKHGDALMMLPGVMGTWVDFDPKHQTFVIVISVSQTPATIKGLPSELDGVPVTLEETGPITAM
jgi:hypothetical protein